jgi:hypothetical protein
MIIYYIGLPTQGALYYFHLLRSRNSVTRLIIDDEPPIVMETNSTKKSSAALTPDNIAFLFI